MISPLLFCFLVFGTAQERTGRSYWQKVAKKELESSLKTKLNFGTAKNVIIFIGDGMGPNTVTAARIYRDGEESYLSWEKFPHLGVAKTYAANGQVPDSANTATAIFTGTKSNKGTLGVDENVHLKDCEGSLIKTNHLTTIATLAQAADKATGIVTTTRVTHATPGAMYAHSGSRVWECDSFIPSNYSMKCKDIGRQLIEDLPGRNFNVILGGGGRSLGRDPQGIHNSSSCVRSDGRNLISEWADDKAFKNLRYSVVNNTKTLLSVNTSETDYLLGIFADSHMALDFERDTSEEGSPSLEEMTATAINVLKNNKEGFVLMVESGLIDIAHHQGKARKAIHEVLSLNNAVNGTVRLLDSLGLLEETLIIVTSDHSHTLTISGYPARGNSVFGIAGRGLDNIPYTTLGYANSVKENYQYQVVDNKVARRDPSKEDTSSFEYGVQAAVPTETNTHGGNDVFIYAKGPFAHLFHRVHEQNYITEVMKYAAKLGEYSNSV